MEYVYEMPAEMLADCDKKEAKKKSTGSRVSTVFDAYSLLFLSRISNYC